MQSGGRCIAVTIHDSGARTEWVVSVTPRPLNPWEVDEIRIVQKVGLASETV
jgi:hypothetical protein